MSRRRLYASPVPFGLGLAKPKHYRAMARIVWENRDALPYAFRVLTEGTCDGCALGTSGLRDWTLGEDAVHLCMVRLELLRLNTMPAIPDFEARLADPAALAELSSRDLRELGRLSLPMRWRAGERGYRRIAWEEFFAEAGARIRALASPDRFALYLTSRGITNETYYAAQKMARFIGTNNVDNSARLCHSPSTAGLRDTIGVAATTCSYKDWYESDLIVFFGSNPANDQPVSMKYLHEAKQRGARVITVNTYREPGMETYWVPSNLDSALFGTRVSDAFYLVHVGGDLAFLNAVQRHLIANGLLADDFIAAHTNDFPAYRAALLAADPAQLAERAGVTADEVAQFADEVAAAKRMVLVWSMGITQHAHGADTVRAIANLALLRGAVGVPGSGLMPIRGHSGVQGGAEMGAYATAFPGGRPIEAGEAARLSALYGFPVPAAPGLTTTAMLDAAEAGQLEVFHIVGGNFLETLPQPDHVRAALAQVPVRIHQDIVLTSQMLIPPKEVSYLLPARTRYEQRDGGTETTTERRVVFSPEIEGHPIGEALSEWEILMRLGEAVFPERRALLHFADGHALRSEIGRVIESYAPIERLRTQGDQFQWGGPHLCANGQFPLPGGRARFVRVAPPDRKRADNELWLATRRGKQFNSMVQGNTDPLTQADRDHVLMSEHDAQRFRLSEGEAITLISAYGRFAGRVMFAPVRAGNCEAHWPECNGLLPRDRIDPDGGVPDYNARVRVVRRISTARGSWSSEGGDVMPPAEVKS